MDAGPGVNFTDYSTFSPYARHESYQIAPVQYADNHVIIYHSNGLTPVLASTNFYRGSSNTAIFPDAPYFWW